MQVQINSDASVVADQALERRVEHAVRDGLERFAEHLSRAEVHLSDANSESKGGADDMHCTLEVRMRGREPQAVSHHAPTIELAAKGAIEKMGQALASTMGKLDARRHARPQPGADGDAQRAPDADEPPDAPPAAAR
ncbi:MAG: HPF/RaiA family ribosome-associated protein [Lautropia sp.]